MLQPPTSKRQIQNQPGDRRLGEELAEVEEGDEADDGDDRVEDRPGLAAPGAHQIGGESRGSRTRAPGRGGRNRPSAWIKENSPRPRTSRIASPTRLRDAKLIERRSRRSRARPGSKRRPGRSAWHPGSEALEAIRVIHSEILCKSTIAMPFTSIRHASCVDLVYSGPLMPPSLRTRQKWTAISTATASGMATQCKT